MSGLAKTHGLNVTFRPEHPEPESSLCGLAPWQVQAHANHAEEFGIDCKRCLAMLRWLKDRTNVPAVRSDKP